VPLALTIHDLIGLRHPEWCSPECRHDEVTARRQVVPADLEAIADAVHAMLPDEAHRSELRRGGLALSVR